MYSELNIDLQAFVKKVYFSLLYNSTFYNFLNENYIGEIRRTGAPIIEVIKTTPVSGCKKVKILGINTIRPTLQRKINSCFKVG